MVRAFVVSFILSIPFTLIVIKINLTAGIIPSFHLAASLAGFFFIKIWTKFLNQSGLLKQPFTRQENTIIQTCVLASSGIAFGCISILLLFFLSLLSVFLFFFLVSFLWNGFDSNASCVPFIYGLMKSLRSLKRIIDWGNYGISFSSDWLEYK